MANHINKRPKIKGCIGMMLLIILIFPFMTRAQIKVWNPDRPKIGSLKRFKYCLAGVNAAYFPPKGLVYNQVNATYKFPTKDIRMNPQDYSLMTKDSNIVITFGNYIIGNFAGNSTRFICNTAYLRTWNGGIKHFVTNFKTFDSSLLKKINATLGVSYDIAATNPYFRPHSPKKKYYFLKTVVLQRRDLGGVKIHFFAKDKKGETRINRLIRQTWGMIQFKPDSVFNFEKRAKMAGLVGQFRHLGSKEKSKYDKMFHRENKYSFWENNARLAVIQCSYDTAEKYLLKMHAIRPYSLDPYQKIFEMYKDAGMYKKAKKYWFKIKKAYLLPLYELSQKKKEDWFETIVDNKMEKAYGVTVLLQRDYASLLYSKKEYNATIKAYKKLLEIRPNDYKTYYKLGLIYREKGEMNTAVPYYQKGQEISKKVTYHHTENTDVNYLLAMYYYHLKPPQKEKAKSYFKKALLGGHVLPRNIKREFNLWSKKIPIKKR